MHAELKRMSGKWEQSGRPDSLLLSSRKEMTSWSEWAKFNKTMMTDHEMKITEQQWEFVQRSLQRARRARTRRRALALVALTLIVAGAIGSAVMAVKATSWAKAAMENAALARYQRDTVTAWALAGAEDGGRAGVLGLRALGTGFRMLEDTGSRPDLEARLMKAFRRRLNPGIANVAELRRGTGKLLWVRHALYSPDGLRLMTLGPIDDVEGWVVYGAATGTRIGEASLGSISGHPQWRPDSRQAAMVNGQVWLWDMASDLALQRHEAPRRLQSPTDNAEFLAYSPDGSILAVGNRDGSVVLWLADVGGRFESHYEVLQASNSSVTSLAWTPFASPCLQLAVGRSDGTATLWRFPDVGLSSNSAQKNSTEASADALDSRHISSGQEHAIGRVEFSPGGETLALGQARGPGAVASGAYGNIWLADVTGQSELWPEAKEKTVHLQYEGGEISKSSGSFSAFAWAPSGRLLATAILTESKVVLWGVWDLDNPYIDLEMEFPERCTSLAWSPTGKFLATGHADNSIFVSDVFDTGNYPWYNRKVTDAHSLRSSISYIHWHPSERQLASVVFTDPAVQIWDVSIGRENSPEELLQDPVMLFFGLAWRPDGSLLATGNQDGTVRIIQTDTLSPGKPLPDATVTQILSFHSGDVLAVSWSPSGRKLASASTDKSVAIWRVDGMVANSQPLQHLAGHGDWARALAWSPDGRFLASGSEDTTVRLWEDLGKDELHLAQVLSGHHHRGVRIVAWHPSPEQRLLATAGRHDRIVLYDLTDAPDGSSTPRQQVLDGHMGGVLGLMWSPSGQILASCGKDSMLRIWDPQSGQATSVETHHGRGVDDDDDGGAIRRVAWSPDGSQLASGGADGLVNVWEVSDAGTLGLTASLTGHPSSVTSLAWSPHYHSSKATATTPPYLLASTSYLPHNWSQPLQSGPAALWNLSSPAQQLIQLEYFRANGTLNTAAYTVKWHPTKPLFATTNREFDMGGGSWSPAKSPDENTLSSFAGTIRLWDHQGTPAYSTVIHGTGYSHSVSWSSTSNAVVTCGGQRMRFWGMDSPVGPRGRGGMSVSATQHFSTCLFSPDGKRIFAGFFSGHVSLYSLVRDDAGRLGLINKQDLLSGDRRLGSFVFQAAWAPDGLGVVAMEDSGRRFHIFGLPQLPDTDAGASDDDLAAALTAHHTVEMAKGDKAASVAISSYRSGSGEESLVAVPLTNSSVLLWRLSDLRSQGSEAIPHRMLFESRGSPGNHQEKRSVWGAAAFSPCGTLLVSVFNGLVLRIWDVESGSIVRELKGHEGQVSSLEWSPDGQMIASASHDTTIRLWLVGSLLEGEAKAGSSRNPDGPDPPGSIDEGPPQHLQEQDEEQRDDVSMQVLGSLGAWATRTAFSPDSGSLAAIGIGVHLHVYKYLRPASAKERLHQIMVGTSELMPGDAAILGLPLLDLQRKRNH